MDILNFYTGIYSLIRNHKGVNPRLFAPLRKFTVKMANRYLPVYLAKRREHRGERLDNLIVSLTSFPARIDNVWQVIECMLHQTMLPKKVILWLSKEQFPSRESIPSKLLSLENGIFEIRFVDGDIKSHKKWFYAFREFHDELVFLIDDDFYYPDNLIEKTMSAYKTNPGTVICNYGRKPLYDDMGTLQPYNCWRAYHSESSTKVFFGSGGGTLIKPSLLHEDTLNIDLCLSLTPMADDIWLNAMCNLAGLKKHLLKYGAYLPILNENNSTLCSVNVEQNLNDVQLNDVVSYYKTNFKLNPFKRN